MYMRAVAADVQKCAMDARALGGAWLKLGKLLWWDFVNGTVIRIGKLSVAFDLSF